MWEKEKENQLPASWLALTSHSAAGGQQEESGIKSPCGDTCSPSAQGRDTCSEARAAEDGCRRVRAGWEGGDKAQKQGTHSKGTLGRG